MKLRLFMLSGALSLFALSAWANTDVLVVVNSNNKVEKLSKKELQNFYSGESSKFEETKVKAKICINITLREAFFQKIELSENQATANKAKLQATGRAENVLTPKPLESKDVVEYIARNQDGGICFLPKDEYEKLADADKKTLKIVHK